MINGNWIIDAVGTLLELSQLPMNWPDYGYSYGKTVNAANVINTVTFTVVNVAVEFNR